VPRSPSRSGAFHARVLLAVGVLIPVLLLCSQFAGEFSMETTVVDDMLVRSPAAVAGGLFLYAFLGVLAASVAAFAYFLLVGRLHLASLYLLPVLVYDTTFRLVLPAVVPSSVMVGILSLFLLYLVHRRARVDWPVFALLFMALFHFCAKFLRADPSYSILDFQLIGYFFSYLIYFNASGSAEEARRTLGLLVVLTALSFPQHYVYIAESLGLSLGMKGALTSRLSYYGGGDVNSFAVAAGVTFMTLLILALDHRHFRRGTAWALGLVLALSLVLSGSRTQLFVTLVFVVAAFGWKTLTRHWLASAIVSAAAIGLLVAFADYNAVERLSEFEATFSGRTENLATALDVIADHVALGVNNADWLDAFRFVSGKDAPVHNPFLSVFVYGGLLAGIANFLFWAGTLATAVRGVAARTTRRYGYLLIVVLLIQFSIFYVQFLPFALMGLVARICAGGGGAERAEPSALPPLPARSLAVGGPLPGQPAATS